MEYFPAFKTSDKIGRASCRERVSQSVEISVVLETGKYSINVWVYEKYRRFCKQRNIPLMCGYTRNIGGFESIGNIPLMCGYTRNVGGFGNREIFL
jgi:hypothetical protein